jgi:hypothetical protein
MEQKKKSIGTTTYLVTQLDAISALKIQTKLIKILGTGAISLLSEGKDLKEKLADAIPKLMESFDDSLVNELVLSLYERNVLIEKEGTPIKLDFATHFAGKPMEMWQVTKFILEANFSMGESSELDSPIT